MKKRYSFSILLTIFTLCAVYTLSNIFKLVGNIVMPIFQEKFSMSSGLTGFITGTYYIAYAPLQLLAAPLCNKWGSEKVIGTSLLFGAVGALLWSTATNSTAVLFGRVFLGLGVGPSYIGTLYYISKYAINNDYTLFASIAMATGGLGSVVSSLPLSILIQKRGESEVFFVIALIMTAVAVLLFVLFLFNKRTHEYKINISSSATENNVFKNLKESLLYILKYPPLIFGVFMWAMFNSYQLCYQGLWSAKWSAVAYPSFSSISGLTGSICSLGFVISSIVSEPLRRKSSTRLYTVKNSEYFLAIMGFITIAVHLIVYIPISNVTILYVAKCISDFFLGYAMGHFCIQMTAYTKEITRSDMNANVMGIMNGGGSLFCLLFQYLTGFIFDKSVIKYDANISYAISFVVVAIVLLLVSIFTTKAQEKYKNTPLS